MSGSMESTKPASNRIQQSVECLLRHGSVVPNIVLTALIAKFASVTLWLTSPRVNVIGVLMQRVIRGVASAG